MGIEDQGTDTNPTETPHSVAPPLPPDDSEAWYAPHVQEQYEVHPDVVVTVRRHGGEFTYTVREPSLTTEDRRQRRSETTLQTLTSSAPAPARVQSR